MKVLFGIVSLFWKLYIAIVFFTLALLLYPFFLLVLNLPKYKKVSFKLFILWSHLFRICCFYPIRKIQHGEKAVGPYIIIANHTSYLDIFLMYSILPSYPFVFLGKSEILSYPIIRTYFKNLNIPVDRKNKSKAGQAYIAATKAFEDGYGLVIFPEGTFPTEDLPRMLPFKNGAFKLAKQLNVPILPLTFMNNYKLFSDPSVILGPARPGISTVHIHPLITVETIQQMELQELSDHCYEVITVPLRDKNPEVY